MAFESDRDLEELYRSAVAGLYARLRSNYNFLYEKFGDEGLNLIAEMSRSYGLEVAERASLINSHSFLKSPIWGIATKRRVA